MSILCFIVLVVIESRRRGISLSQCSDRFYILPTLMDIPPSTYIMIMVFFVLST